MHTTQQVYDRYHIRLWRLFIARKDARIKAAYPETGGVELYLHNWYVCGGTAAGREPGASERAEAMIRAEWDQWHKVSKRGEREYARAEHATHTGFAFRPLWCLACENERGEIIRAHLAA